MEKLLDDLLNWDHEKEVNHNKIVEERKKKEAAYLKWKAEDDKRKEAERAAPDGRNTRCQSLRPHDLKKSKKISKKDDTTAGGI